MTGADLDALRLDSAPVLRSSGVVVRVGSSVKTHKVRDRVALEPGVSCRTCPACKVSLGLASVQLLSHLIQRARD